MEWSWRERGRMNLIRYYVSCIRNQASDVRLNMMVDGADWHQLQVNWLCRECSPVGDCQQSAEMMQLMQGSGRKWSLQIGVRIGVIGLSGLDCECR